MDAYPALPLGIEIKEEGVAGAAAADALVEVLRDRNRLDGVVVSSFSDDVIAHVEAIAPEIETSPGPAAVGALLLDGTALPFGQRILQLPSVFGDTELLTPDYISLAHDAGYVIWVWPGDRELETPEAYAGFLADGIDGLNINFPAAGVAAVEYFVASTTPSG